MRTRRLLNRVSEWKPENKAASFFGLTFTGDSAVMMLHNGFYNRKTKAASCIRAGSTGFLHRIGAFKDFLNIASGDTDAVVSHVDDKLRALYIGTKLYVGDTLALFECIGEQVVQYTLDKDRIYRQCDIHIFDDIQVQLGI